MSLKTWSSSATFKKDIQSGIIVFLIALPLCLGIAQASQAPLFSGVIAGIVGGLVIGFFSKSQLSVSGPAAGLVAIVITAISDLGAFNIFVCAVIIAGFIQVFLGFLRAGGIANYFPINVIEGMLAGIGITIVLKQFPDAIGYVNKNYIAGLDPSNDGWNTININNAFHQIHLGAIIIAVLGIAILALWQTKAMKKFKMIPAGLLVVIIGVGLNQIFLATGSSLALDKTHLVALTVPTSLRHFFSQFSLPDFTGFLNPAVWKTGLVIAIVGSIETLLCIEATDKLDPQKRFTNGDSELKAQGIGNMVSGLIGGLPITSVIVRSSANIDAGARTKLSTMVHGTLLLVCAASIPALLNLIPKASLAAILIFTGYRLTRPAIYVHIWKTGGMSQFLPFIVTILAIMFSDLLRGVGLGLIFSVLYLLRQNLNIPFFFQRKITEDSDVIRMELAQEVSFLNKASIKQTLQSLPLGSTVIIDASQSEYIDFDVRSVINDFSKGQAIDKKINLSLIGFKNIYGLESSNGIVEDDYFEASDNSIKSAGKYKKLIKQLNGNAPLPSDENERLTSKGGEKRPKSDTVVS